MLTLIVLGALLGLAAAQNGCADSQICVELKATGPVDPDKEIGYTCIDAATGSLYGNDLDPTCTGCVDPSNNLNTAELCTAPKTWFPTSCGAMQAGTPVSSCGFLLPFVLTPNGLDCCTSSTPQPASSPPSPAPAALCDQTTLRTVLATLSSSCQALLGGALASGTSLDDDTQCPCFLEASESTASALTCLGLPTDDQTVYETWLGCATPQPSPTPTPTPTPVTCPDLKAAYMSSGCCGASKDKLLSSSLLEILEMATCGDVKDQYQALSCCPLRR